MTKLYEIATSILQNGTDYIQSGLYQSSQLVFNNSFFNIVFSLSIVYLGFMIAFKRFSSEDIAYRAIWLIVVISFVKTVIYNQNIYNLLISLLNTPRDMFLELIYNFVSNTNSSATVKNIIDNISSSISQLATYLFNQSGWSNISAFFYGIIVLLSGSFLLVITLLNSIFSVFLSDVILSLMPFVLPFLIWKKSESMFYSWIKLYISVSLYAPFTLLFGLISVQTSEFTINVTHAIQSDFQENAMYIFVLVIVQLLTAIAIFKIPNIINQIIGSSNEGSSLTSGVGTLSAGGAIIGAVSKYSGLTFSATKVGKMAKSTGAKFGDRFKDTIKDKISMR